MPVLTGFRGAHNIADRATREAFNRVNSGKFNATTSLTLTANVGTTTLTDARIGPTSFLAFMPTTANAATEFGAGTLYPSALTKGSATITHVNNAQTDRTFTVLIIG